MLSRRELFQAVLANTTLLIARIAAADIKKNPSPEYLNISHSKLEWNGISKGVEFARIEVWRHKELIDVLAVVRIDPRFNRIRVLSAYEEEKTVARTIEDWQKQTGAIAMTNSAQYMADPYYMPCALIICDGKLKGPKSNSSVRGMLVAEPVKKNLPLADLLDFEYDRYTPGTYQQGVQHWPILLDRHGKIKVKKTGWQANRTIVAKDFDDKILLITTEGNFFTLHNLGLFLKESNARPDRGLRIHTAMNLDGGSEANMVVKAGDFSYVRYGPFEAQKKPAFSLFNWKVKIPGAIGVFAR
ncbi:phosphodiester glycosidase family protein [bacterium]|nr:phosphodiester glycosidase family protein [bacterium]